MLMHNLNSKLKIFCKYTFKVFLSQKGHVFESDTDTEVIAKLVRCAKKIILISYTIPAKKCGIWLEDSCILARCHAFMPLLYFLHS